jgi:hypothetical protein
MGEEFYCVIKLVSGEEIFSLISVDENDGDPIIILQNPVIMKMISNELGNYIKIKNWMDITSDDIFIIKLDKVITMTESTDESIISIYEEYVYNDQFKSDDPSGKVKISNKMGYISTVEDARKSLEDIFNNKNL